MLSRPGLANQYSLLVTVRDLTKSADHVVNLGPIMAVKRVLLTLHVPGNIGIGGIADRIVAQLGILDETGDHVDTKTVSAAIEPEADDVVHRVGHVGISIIQIGLLLEEDMQVPRCGSRIVLPRGTAEVALPIVRCAIGRTGNPDVPVALWIAARRPRLDEPRMLIRGMVGHQVDDHADIAAMRLREQAIEGGEIAELRMDSAVVADVVAPVVERRRVDRVQPDRIDAERAQIVEMRGDAVEIADAVAVRIGKRARIDLIEDGALPPL